MDESELEPDPRHRVPTFLWLILGLLLVAVFVAVVFMLSTHGQPRAIGPPPGTP